jgi:hypothetical protein
MWSGGVGSAVGAAQQRQAADRLLERQKQQHKSNSMQGHPSALSTAWCYFCLPIADIE